MCVRAFQRALRSAGGSAVPAPVASRPTGAELTREASSAPAAYRATAWTRSTTATVMPTAQNGTEIDKLIFLGGIFQGVLEFKHLFEAGNHHVSRKESSRLQGGRMRRYIMLHFILNSELLCNNCQTMASEMQRFSRKQK